MKTILRRIAGSAAYGQSSRVTAELLSRDDKSRLYACGPRLRLDAETVRDNALATAGLLSLKQGGRRSSRRRRKGSGWSRDWWTIRRRFPRGRIATAAACMSAGDRRTTASDRHHHRGAFTRWLAGGGVKRGFTWGRTDELGCTIVENPVHVHHLNATVLHLMGLDHTRLTFKYQGRQYRLTDVRGNVVHDLLA
jgi:hypothetical protein